jgi:DNA polymerase
MQLDTRQLKILQEMGVPMSGFALRNKAVRARASLQPDASARAESSRVNTDIKAPAVSHSPPIEIAAKPSQAAPNSNTNRRPVSPHKPEFVPTHVEHIQSLQWDALKEHTLACQGCALANTRQRVVWGSLIEASSSKSNPPKSLEQINELDWLVIDSSPNDLEDQTANPLASESGQLLANMLKTLRMLDQQPNAQSGQSPASSHACSIGLINAVKCHPPGGRNPDEFEINQCKPYLTRQIELLKPKGILILGQNAYKSIFTAHTQAQAGETQTGHLASSSSGSSSSSSADPASNVSAKVPPLTQLRNEVLHINSVPSFVTYHPGSLILHPQDKAKAWHDLSRAHAYLRAHEQPTP